MLRSEIILEQFTNMKLSAKNLAEFNSMSKKDKLKNFKQIAYDVMDILYEKNEISKKLKKTMFEVIKKCPTIELLIANMDFLGINQLFRVGLRYK